MEYLSLGKIVDSFGIDGTIKIYSTTSFGSKRYKAGSKVFLVNPLNQEMKECEVVKYRHSGFFDFVKFVEFNSPEEVKELKGYEIQVIKDNKDLNKGEYFYSDLRGCRVVDDKNNKLGIVKEVEEFPAQITLRVSRKGNRDFFVPFIKEFIKDVNISDKTIVINVIEGLLWR